MDLEQMKAMAVPLSADMVTEEVEKAADPALTDRMKTRAGRVGTRKQAVAILQMVHGLSRREARDIVYGQGRREVHETRRGALARKVGVNAAARRWRRRQAVASSVAVSEAAF